MRHDSTSSGTGLERRSGDAPGEEDIGSLLFQKFRRQRQEVESSQRTSISCRNGLQSSLVNVVDQFSARASGQESDQSNGPYQLPEVGAECFGFRLHYELGRGAFARVYLAEQIGLAGRPVVLKISSIDGNEPETLAQLQHTHIVPIYSLHEDARSGLRAVCMPYFGGASLSNILKMLWAADTRPTQGDRLVQALDQTQAPSLAQITGKSATCGAAASNSEPQAAGEKPVVLLAGLSYHRAAAWIVARLAEGLQHAHQRGVLHRDIKPSNILVGADGQPLLLDFNLSHSASDAAQAQASAVLGGTVAYMAPEHLRAMASHSAQPRRPVDQRADIYALGMVLYEMLTGHNPFDQIASYQPLPVMIEAMALERSQKIPSARKRRSDVPWGLESVVRKCLAPDPAQRYQQAEHLADDLRRYLEDRPFRYAPELSRTEQLRKWLRRHPRLASAAPVASVALMLLVGTGLAILGLREHLRSTEQHLEEAKGREQERAVELGAAQSRERKRAFAAGTVRALCLVNTTTDLHDHYRQGQSVCEEVLGLYAVLDRDDWQQTAAWRQVAPDERRLLAEDVRELLLLLAWAQVHTTSGDASTLQEALVLLERAEQIEDLGPSRALWEDRAFYLALLGDKTGAQAARQTAARLRPASARDHYLLATAYARGQRYAQAVTELDAALELNPHHYWSWVQRGICHQELGDSVMSASDFGVCIGLRPEFAWGYFNRGYVLDRSGHKAEAVRDYTAALERDAELLVARVNRGLALLELKQYAQALADFDRAADLGRDDAFLHAGRGVALEGLGRHPEADRTFEAAFTRARRDSKETRHRLLWVYGFAVSARLPEKAREAFDSVLRDNPDQPQALYGRAMLLAGQGETRLTLQLLKRALDVTPGFLEARRARAILWARLGHYEEAAGEITWCLGQEPASGQTLYSAACVAAQAAHSSDPVTAKSAKEQALAFLHQAFAHGYGQDRAAEDPDLEVLRSHPEFERLVRPAETMSHPKSK
jgi:serine/threonine protein kinase/Flp pilus assembly protein TadD